MSNHVNTKQTVLINTSLPWMTSQDFPLPIYPSPHHMLLVHRNIPDLLRTVHQPWLEFGEEQFDHHFFYPSLSEALGTWNTNVPVFCHKQEVLKSCYLGDGYPYVYQNYIHKIAVILHDSLQGESHKPFSPSTSVTRLQLLCMQTNMGILRFVRPCIIV